MPAKIGFDVALDLNAYFSRIGYSGARAPTLATLGALQAAHMAAIPFENLDPLLERPVPLDASALEEKLVRRKRGGYCFEQNGLFHEVLAALGFTLTALAARVLWMLPEGSPRPALTHRFMLVDLPEGRFVADVGFGGPGATMPLRLASGETQSTPHGAYRIVKDDDMFRLELRLPERWESLYCFSLAPQHHRDFEVGNWFTSTHPASRFRQQLVVARIDGSQRLQLRNRTFGTRFPDGTLKESAVTSAEQLAALLEDRFGIALPAPAAEIWARLPA